MGGWNEERMGGTRTVDDVRLLRRVSVDRVYIVAAGRECRVRVLRTVWMRAYDVGTLFGTGANHWSAPG